MTTVLIALAAIGVTVLVVAPLESILWWWGAGARDTLRARDEFAQQRRSPAAPPDGVRCYVVYLSGIASVDENAAPRPERAVLRRVEQAFGDLLVVSRIYPYSVTNRGLVTSRRTAAVWRRLAMRRRPKILAALGRSVINLRNVAQVLVSADPRYGPVFSAGIATTIWKQLRDAGYRPNSDDQVVLLGWSGGAQIAAGAAWYLGAAGARVSLISLGGVFSADPGLDRCERIVHLTGSRDWQCRYLPLVFPGRRNWSRRSSWWRAQVEGRVTQTVLGPFKHVGRGSYLSGQRMCDGRSCSEITSDAVVTVIADAGLATPRVAPAGRGVPEGHAADRHTGKRA